VEEIVTGEAVILDLPVAQFPTRMLARIIDMAAQATLFLIVAILVTLATEAAILVTTLVVVLVGYPVALETLSRGRTLGKLALGLRVVADDGGPVRFRQALVRGLAAVVECWSLVGVPALITSMLSARGKRLGDVFAGTFVVRVRTPRSVGSGFQAQAYGTGGYGAGSQPAWFPVEPVLQPWTATLDLAGLREPLAVSAATFLSRYWQLDARTRDQLGRQLASDVIRCLSPLPPPGLPPVAYLNAVLAERRNRDLARLRAASPPPVVPPFTPPFVATSPVVLPPVAPPPVAPPPVAPPPVAPPPVAPPPVAPPSGGVLAATAPPIGSAGGTPTPLPAVTSSTAALPTGAPSVWAPPPADESRPALAGQTPDSNGFTPPT
jgi:uncharacterized RDD family membrane protein YckC